MRMPKAGYLTEGMLTTFAGVPFGQGHPYSYPEAKDVLGLAMERLCRHPDLKTHLNIGPDCLADRAIKGQGWPYVWNVLVLRETGPPSSFEKVPHLTLGIRRDDVLVKINFPNQMKGEYRKRIVALGPEGFSDLLLRVEGGMRKSLRKALGFVPCLEVLQRRFRHRSSPPTFDARLEADLRTALPYADRGEVKHQPEWVRMAFSLFAKKRSNLQLGVGAIFPYDRCARLKTPEALDDFAAAWIACKPVIDVVLGQ